MKRVDWGAVQGTTLIGVLEYRSQTVVGGFSVLGCVAPWTLHLLSTDYPPSTSRCCNWRSCCLTPDMVTGQQKQFYLLHSLVRQRNEIKKLHANSENSNWTQKQKLNFSQAHRTCTCHSGLTADLSCSFTPNFRNILCPHQTLHWRTVSRWPRTCFRSPCVTIRIPLLLTACHYYGSATISMNRNTQICISKGLLESQNGSNEGMDILEFLLFLLF